ncbi:hypothetical protein FQN54_001455 [Arachnomyces sp. PD_36]|nr:hypothetical protein FQN54_001455 [Arachnomyces sp. PD_36]
MSSDSEPDHTLESEEEQVARLLDEVAANPTAEEVWEELIDCLCHQGDLYPESLPSLPRLASFATSWPLSQCLDPLFLASMIVASANDSDEKEDMHRQYASDFASLISRVHECLSTPSVFEKDNAFIHLLSALLAFEGESPWDRKIERLTDGEYNLECPSCEAYLYIELDDSGGFVTSEDPIAATDAPRAALLPATPPDLNVMAHRLYTIATEQKQEGIATRLLHLFGSATCPECEDVFRTEEPLLID